MLSKEPFQPNKPHRGKLLGISTKGLSPKKGKENKKKIFWF